MAGKHRWGAWGRILGSGRLLITPVLVACMTACVPTPADRPTGAGAQPSNSPAPPRQSHQQPPSPADSSPSVEQRRDTPPKSGQLNRSTSSGAPTSAAEQTSAHSSTVRLPRVPAPATKDQLEQEAYFVVAKLQRDLQGHYAALHVAALLNAQLHKTTEAVQLWRKCLEAAPETEEFYINLAALQLDRGEAHEAEQVLRQAVSRGLTSPDIFHHLSLALVQTGKIDEAAELAKQVLADHPNSGGHWLLLGQAQLKLGQTKEAEASLRKAIELGSGGKSAYFALFNACLRNGNRDDAMKYRDIYLSFDDKSNASSSQNRYQALSEAEARRVCVSVFSEAAALYSATNKWQEAEHLLLRILALEPGNLAACQELARVYEKLDLPVNELVVRERTSELDPFNLMNYLMIAKRAATMNDHAKAEANIKLAISMAPQSIIGYSAMADFQLEIGAPRKALWYVQHALEISPSPQGYRLLAKVWRTLGDAAQAEQAERQAAQLETSTSNN
ncbi:MAG: hypothetical protein KatS3mg111_0684 [Pirellulaceae bacterium]|nr:MAG: hypothetical protein KatS3mg111_0684 [Pirellulaceae bacterium]